MPYDKHRISTGALAFLGDGVYSLLVREELVLSGASKSATLHAQSIKMVCAASQAIAAKKISEILTSSEKEVFTRGRNLSLENIPKTATRAEYQAATALETLFGHLFLEGNFERMRELYNAIKEEFV
jgi:ribonuclease-3 family protein